MYKENYRPFYKNGETGSWERVPVDLIFGKSQTVKASYEISWDHEFDGRDEVYFSFCYPLSYTENQTFLDGLSAKYGDCREFYFYRENLINSCDGRR
jgi:hypothetical protein